LTLKDELKAINANYAEKTESLQKTVNSLESTSVALQNDLYII
jgi:exonuclease VII small subunit